MKDILKTITLLLAMITSNQIQGNPFLKNVNIIETYVKLGIYNAENDQKSNHKEESSEAAAMLYPVSIKYTVAKKLSIDLINKYHSYSNGKADTLNPNTKVKSFQKNDKIIEAGFGLGIYDSEIYQKSTNNREKSKAAAWVYPVSFEYAVASRLGIGIGYKHSAFITGKDDTVNTNAKIKGNDLVLKPTFHFIKSKRIDMYVGALAGISWFNFQVNDANQSYAKGNGTILAFIFGTRFYFSKNIALSLNYAFNNYNFVNITLADNLGYSDQLDLSLKRGNVGIGLVFKFN